MSENKTGSIVNEHYLNKVLDLSEDMGVVATEDIYDTQGMKLLAKGADVTRRLQERLIVHRLRKPIESCIAVEGAVDGAQLATCATQACEASPALAALLAASNLTASAIHKELAAYRFSPAMAMMLTMIARSGA
jgi:hypothetical protein